MSEPLAITLALENISSSGAGDSIDLGLRRRAILLEGIVKAISGTGRLFVKLETSSDETLWTKCDEAFIEQGSVEVKLAGFGLQQFVRVAYVVTGSISATVQLSGEAHVVYATPKNISSVAANARSFEEVPLFDQVEACVTASSEADGYIGNAYKLPLKSWGPDLTKHTAAIAAETMFSARGLDPDGPDAVIIDRKNKAIQWLDRLGNGRLSPPELIDSTPEEFEGVCVVVSQPSRGTW